MTTHIKQRWAIVMPMRKELIEDVPVFEAMRDQRVPGIALSTGVVIGACQETTISEAASGYTNEEGIWVDMPGFYEVRFEYNAFKVDRPELAEALRPFLDLEGFDEVEIE